MKKVFLFLLCLFAFFFFLPYLASTSLGQKVSLQLIGWKMNAKVDASSIRLSWLGPQLFSGLNVKNQNLDGSCQEFTAYMPLWRFSKLDGPFTISKGALKLHTSSCQNASLENLEARIEGENFTAEGSARSSHQKGSFAVSGSLKKFPGDCSLQGSLTSIPSCLLDELLQTPRWIEEILGPILSLEGSITAQKNQGSFDLSLNSSNCQTKINASFNGSEIRLQKPLAVSLLPTPALSRLLMKEVNPLFLASVEARHAISIYLSPTNFSFPYAPFQLDSLSIERGSIDLGQVVIQTGPSLQSLLTLLNNRRLQNSSTLNAWFTPLTFELKNGSLKADRLDVLLANSVHLCSWGKINLLNQKLHMYLGIPASTLASSFNISGLNRDYVLKIPVRGTISKPELITGPAVAQITALAGSQNLPLPKVGKLFGKFVQTVSELKSDADVPPAKRPFPWER